MTRPEMTMSKNRFADAADATELMHQVIGAGSMCWEDLSGAGVFDSTEAAKIAKEAVERFGELVPGDTR